MHDKNGKPLKVGDIVVIECVVKEAYPTPDYCNCTLETVHGRRPDGKKETISAINTGVVELVTQPAPTDDVIIGNG